MDGSASPSAEEAGGTCKAAAVRAHQKKAASELIFPPVASVAYRASSGVLSFSIFGAFRVCLAY